MPPWGRASPGIEVVPWAVCDDSGNVVEPIELFLRDILAQGNQPGSVRSYA